MTLGTQISLNVEIGNNISGIAQLCRKDLRRSNLIGKYFLALLKCCCFCCYCCCDFALNINWGCVASLFLGTGYDLVSIVRFNETTWIWKCAKICKMYLIFQNFIQKLQLQNGASKIRLTVRIGLCDSKTE